MASIAPRRRIALSEGLTGAAASSKEPVIVGDVREDPRYIAVEPDVRSELVMPLVFKGRVVGVFDLESRELNRFTHEHIKVLTPLASQFAVAIENARLYEDITKRETRYPSSRVILGEAPRRSALNTSTRAGLVTSPLPMSIPERKAASCEMSGATSTRDGSCDTSR